MIYRYIRFSSEKQDEESQKALIDSYCQSNGIRIDKTIKDSAISGASDLSKRELSALLGKLKEGDTLIVSELSRLTRKGAVELNDMIKNYFQPAKLRLIICNYNLVIDCNNICAMTELMLNMMGTFARIERDAIIARTKGGIKAAHAKGSKSGRQSPKYGTGENYLINHAAGRIKCSETFVNKRLNNTETQTIIEAIAVAVPTIKEFDVEGSEYPFLGWWRASNLTKEQWARVVELIKYAETRSATPLIEKEDWTLVDIKARFKYLFGTRFRPMAEKIYNYGEPITPQKND